MPSQNTFTARGGVTGPESEYGAGVPYYDTLGGMAVAFKRANPDDRRSVDQIALDIARINGIETKPGVACDDVTKIKDARIYRGRTYTLPPGNPINPELHYDCPPDRVVQPERPAGPVQVEATPTPDIPAPQPEEALIPRAQAIFTPMGARQYTAAINRFDFFKGKPPRDPAAMGTGRNDRLVKGALTPGESEGTRFAGQGPRNAFGAVSDVLGMTPVINTSRAGENSGAFGELTYKPSQQEFMGANGELVGRNSRFPYKFEQQSRFVVSPEGQLVSTIDGSALISQERRLNPAVGNRWRDDETARNKINSFNNTPEGLDSVVTYMGIDRALGIREQAFFGEGKTPTTKDAEEMLQLQLQTALHPMVWSVDSRGMPVGNYDTIRNEVGAIFSSPQFASLPEQDQARLRSTYEPLVAKIEDPRALDAAIAANGGRADWINPMTEWAAERSQLKFIREGYGDRPDGPLPNTPMPNPNVDPRGAREWRQARRDDRVVRTEEVGNIYANAAWNTTIRTPRSTEYQAGMGLLSNTDQQDAATMSAQRVAFLERLKADPEFRAQYVEQVLTTPGASQSVYENLFVATRGTGQNSKVLGFNSDRDADAFVRDTAEALGGKKYRDKIEYRDLNTFERIAYGAVYLGTAGGVRLGTGRNQTKGITDGFPEAVVARYNDPATRDKVDGAFLGMIDRALVAEKGGIPFAATGMVNAVDANRAQDTNGGQYSPGYQAFLNTARTQGVDQIIFNTMMTNDQGLNASIDRGTDQRVLNGEQTVTISREEAERLANGETITRPVPLAAPAVNGGGDVTVTSGNSTQITLQDGQIVMTEVNKAGENTGVVTSVPTSDVRLAEDGQLSITPPTPSTSDITINTNPSSLDAALATARAQGVVAPAGVTYATTFNVAPAQDARAAIVAGDADAAAKAAAVLATADSPNLVSQGAVSRENLTRVAQKSPALFSLVTVQMLADKEGNAQAHVDMLDRGRAESSNYADLLDKHARAIRAAGGNAELRAKAETEALTAFQGFFADSDKAIARLNGMSFLSSEMQKDTQTVARFAGGYTSTVVADSGAYLKSLVDRGLISQDKADRFAGILSEGNPAVRAQESKEWLAGVLADQDATKAGFGFSWKEIAKLAALTQLPPGDGGNPKVNIVTPPVCPGVGGNTGQDVCR